MMNPNYRIMIISRDEERRMGLGREVRRISKVSPTLLGTRPRSRRCAVGEGAKLPLRLQLLHVAPIAT